MPELDRYEEAGMDDSGDERSLGQIYRDRVAAERDLDRREAGQGRRGRIPDLLAGTSSASGLLELLPLRL